MKFAKPGRHVLTLLCVWAVLSFMPKTNATLIDQGVTTLDTATGFEWLDVYATGGLSYDDLVAGAGGWYAAGYRHATAAEILSLWSDAGFAPGTWLYPNPEAFKVGTYLGLTSAYDPIPGDIPGGTAPELAQFGNYAPAGGGSDRPFTGITFDEEIPLTHVKIADDTANYHSPFEVKKGNFLLRVRVPDAGSSWLLTCIGLAFLTPLFRMR